MDKSRLEELLATMVRSGARSLHIHPGHSPWVRVQNNVVTSSHPAPSGEGVEDLTREFLFADHREQLQREGQVDVHYASREGVRFRVSVQREERGLGIVFRKVSSDAPTFETLSLPEFTASFTGFQRGLVVFTGFFGSGKSSTLAAMVERLNRDSARHVVTIEDPIEYLFPHGQALLHQREVGVHVDSVAEGIEQAVRQGAEVIAVGELRDAAAMTAAMEAVEQGCLVLATVDGSSVVGAMNRMTGFCDPGVRAQHRNRLSRCLRVVMGQMLLTRAHQKGRVPLLEILINNRAVQRSVRRGQYDQLVEMMRRGRGLGMQTTDDGLRNLLGRNLITWDEASFHAVDREWLAARMTAKSAQP